MKYEFIAKNKVNGMFRFLMKDTDSNMLNQVFIYEKDNEEILQNYIYDFLIRNNNQIDYVEKKYSIMVKTPFSNIAFSFYNIPKSFIDFFYFIYAPVIVFNVNCDYEVELLFQDNNFFEIKSEYMSSCDLIYRVMNVIHICLCRIISKDATANKCFVLHASAVKTVNNNIIMIVGDKLSGKTSTLLNYIQNKGIYIGDEALVYDGEKILSYYMPLKVDNNSVLDFTLKDELIESPSYIKGKNFLTHIFWQDFGLVKPTHILF